MKIRMFFDLDQDEFISFDYMRTYYNEFVDPDEYTLRRYIEIVISETELGRNNLKLIEVNDTDRTWTRLESCEDDEDWIVQLPNDKEQYDIDRWMKWTD